MSSSTSSALQGTPPRSTVDLRARPPQQPESHERSWGSYIYSGGSLLAIGGAALYAKQVRHMPNRYVGVAASGAVLASWVAKRVFSLMYPSNAEPLSDPLESRRATAKACVATIRASAEEYFKKPELEETILKALGYAQDFTNYQNDDARAGNIRLVLATLPTAVWESVGVDPDFIAAHVQEMLLRARLTMAGVPDEDREQFVKAIPAMIMGCRMVDPSNKTPPQMEQEAFRSFLQTEASSLVKKTPQEIQTRFQTLAHELLADGEDT